MARQLKLIVLCAVSLLCDAADYLLGPQGTLIDAGMATITSPLPLPTGSQAVRLNASTVCQKVVVPTGGLAVTFLGAFAAGNNMTQRGLNYTLSLYTATRNVSQANGTWVPGKPNILQLPRQPFLRAGNAFICLTALNATNSIWIATENSTSEQRQFNGSMAPMSMGKANITGQSVSLYLIGAPGTVYPSQDQVYTENFDTWPRCDPKGCSVVTGPCAARNGWRNSGSGDYDWSVHFGRTDTRITGQRTGPFADHTTGTLNGSYIYSEASPPCGSMPDYGRQAHLVTPVFQVFRGWYLKINFWMSMVGTGITELHFDVSFDQGLSFQLDALDMIQGNQSAVWVYVSLDFTKVIWDRVSRDGAVVRFRTVTGTVLETAFEGDVAIDDVTVIAYTATPSVTSTLTSSSSATPSLTVLPTTTTTLTVIPTTTPTSTVTATPIRPYDPIGIPDPPDIVSTPWANVYPRMVVVREVAALHVTGHWLYSAEGRVDIKFAIWAENCIGLGVGSSIAALDRMNLGRIQAPTVVGRYMLCIRHRQDWENVAVIDVVPQSVNYSTFGFTTCEQMLRFNPQYCGCWYQKGDLNASGPPVYSLPVDKPEWLLPYHGETVLFEQGCCRRGTQKRYTWPDRSTSFPAQWGVCEDGPPKGQLGDFSYTIS